MIYILVGPSCSGKTTIGRKSGLPELVSHTSRSMRAGEKEGKTYYFVTRKEIRNMDKVEVTEYSNNLYCLSTEEIKMKTEKYDDVFTIMDRYGAQQMIEIYGKKKVKVVYVKVPFWQLVKRLYKRDGFVEGTKRIYHIIKTGELKNDKISDFVLNNEDGNLENAINSFREIISTLAFIKNDIKPRIRTEWA